MKSFKFVTPGICKRIRQLRVMLVLTAMLSVPAAASADPNDLPIYKASKIPAESLTSVGSDSMGGLVQLWVDRYKEFQPEVKLQVASRGSATAPAALIEGSADLGPMSRPMKAAERDSFISTYGFEPTQVKTALSAVAVYVPKTNPLKEITFEQLQSIYGAKEPAASWSSLGVKTSGAADKITALGLSDDPVLGAYFKQRVLLQDPYGDSVMSTQDNASLFKALEMNPGGIGFGPPTANLSRALKIVPVRKSASERAVAPSAANIANGSYPLSRALSIYVVRDPGKAVEPALADFLKFVLSAQGQSIVKEQGLIPLPANVVRAELAKLQ